MNIDKNLTAKLAYTANSTNSVNGGMTEMNMKSTKKENHYVVDMKMPGITPQGLNVEINNDLVLLFLNVDQNGDEFNNYLLTYFRVPYDVNIDQIEADLRGNHLVITMPFDELNDGYSRIVNVKH